VQKGTPVACTNIDCFFGFKQKEFETNKIFFCRASFVLKIGRSALIFYPDVYYTFSLLSGVKKERCRIYAKAYSGAKYGDNTPFTLEEKFALILVSCAL